MAEPDVDENQVENLKQTTLAPLSIVDGTEPMELEVSVRYICERYVSMRKNEGKLLEGLRRLGSLKRVFLPQLMAKNPHYLMRCIECRNIMELAELHMKACLERKETRGCKTCYDLCPEDIFTWNDETHMPHVSYPEECWFCGVCWMMCPKRAIDVILPASLW